MQNLNDVHNILFDRYLKLIRNYQQQIPESSFQLIEKMCLEMLNNNDIPIDKKARWLGFVQGILFSLDLITIDEERNFSRPLFSKFYKNPKTISLN